MNNFVKFRKNAKALSPVVASIILIAVTVAVSVVVAAWMGGMTIGLMGNAEQVSITNVIFDDTAHTMTATVRNTGDASVTISASGYIDTTAAAITGTTTIPKGGSGDVVATAATVDFEPGAQYTLKLITEKGTSVVYTATYTE